MSDLRVAAGPFLEEAERFQCWARMSGGAGGVDARHALLRISQLYIAALTLPSASNDGVSETHSSVNDTEWRTVFDYASQLPVRNYGVVFDPLTVPAEEPVVGDLADDIADIYRDVVTGLREYAAGRYANAVWEWAYGFRHHWGDHATAAIRTLHAWLAANEPDHLSLPKEQAACSTASELNGRQDG